MLHLPDWKLAKTFKAKGIRFDAFEAICRVLDCEPGGIIELDCINKDPAY
ncbi:MAG: hypothetical protein EOO20_29090 [Chryseobacterium sp.]|nr:MAG: hypothetical protein EOO20_29090 [Chryseobacterium sp.]